MTIDRSEPDSRRPTCLIGRFGLCEGLQYVVQLWTANPQRHAADAFAAETRRILVSRFLQRSQCER